MYPSTVRESEKEPPQNLINPGLSENDSGVADVNTTRDWIPFQEFQVQESVDSSDKEDIPGNVARNVEKNSAELARKLLAIEVTYSYKAGFIHRALPARDRFVK